MKVVLIRVDDRLIHGQVVIGWSRTVGATHILVVDDEVAKDNSQKMLLKLAAPIGIKVTILSIAEAVLALTGNKFGNDNVMILVRGPQTLVGLKRGGVAFTKINVGNVRTAQGRERLTKEVAAGPEDLAAWKELDQDGIVLEALWLPGGATTDLNNVIRSHS